MNVDLPQFPGRAGHEFLNTTCLRPLVERLGLVSLIHTSEQLAHSRKLEEAGIDLYAWTLSDWSDQRPDRPPTALSRRILRRGLRELLSFLGSLDLRPRDLRIQDYQFRNVAPALLQALGEQQWQVAVVIQSSIAQWLDYLPRLPATVLVLHDVRSLLYQRRARAAASFGRRLRYWLEARRYRRYERKYCQQVELVVTVSDDDAVWVRSQYRPKQVLTLELPVDSDYFSPSANESQVANRIVFTGSMDHPPNIDAACFFAQDVLPRIREQVGGAEFWI
ncbi:MAG: hypothetical protein JO352_17820, partial [Chloroflexi bacterium]|nr:hypothetical protein [Chloroflexota bacterium]